MAKFNTSGARVAPPRSVVHTIDSPTVTYEGDQAWHRDAKSDLFLLAVTNMVGEETFYESAADRDGRFQRLVHQVTKEDPKWVADFARWLRGPDANMRSASLVLAAEYARAGGPSPRSVVSSVMQRADEPGEFIAYWFSRYGKNLPAGVKRGIADAAVRLYNEQCVLPETLVLTRSLEWVPAGELDVGDELVGFDENIRGVDRGHAAKMAVSMVEAADRADLESFRIITDRGETSVSGHHRFVVRNNWRNREWRCANELVVGDTLLWFGAPWTQDRSYDAGWMAGFLDGEGWVVQKRVGFGQNVGSTLDEAKVVLKRLGFDFNATSQDRSRRLGHRQTHEHVYVAGGRYESMRLLGTVQPTRLSKDKVWVGGNLVSKGPHVAVGNCHAQVLVIEPLGVRENITLGTSTRTFISDGFLSHNSALKYDGTDSNAVRLGDVIELVHPSPSAPWQSALFAYLLDRRHHAQSIRADLTALSKIANARRLNEIATDARRAALREQGADALAEAGFTWERLSGWLPGGMDAEAWEAIIPSMGYMALLRNLRNFDEAKVGKSTIAQVVARLADPEQVARSRQFPYRFLSAYKAAPGFHWAPSLETALDLSTQNIPEFTGKTLVLVDVSGSMETPVSSRSQVKRYEIGALFGAALAHRAKNATLVAFGTNSHEIPFSPALPVLKVIDLVGAAQRTYGLDHGTNTWQAIASHLKDHDRVAVFTDMQSHYGGYDRNVVLSQVGNGRGVKYFYNWNLGGYDRSNMEVGSNGIYEFGGFTDAVFRMIPLLEANRSGEWPWS